MSGKASTSLKELKGLREAVLAEEKARTQALLQNLPDAPSAAPSEETAVPPDVDRPANESESLEPAPTQTLPLSAPVEPAAAKAPVPRPGTPAVTRAKLNKEPALIIPLTPKIQERLQRHVEDARWSPAELVMEIIRVTLHQGYPAIQLGEQLIAKPGTYRTFERHPLEATLKIISGQGVFNVGVQPQNPEYQHWLSYFGEQKAADPGKSAQQVCLFSLQSYLESVEDFKPEGWIKNISVEAYSLVASA